MAAGFIDLFRKVWGWLAVDAGEAPAEVGAQMCVAAVGVYVPCDLAIADALAACRPIATGCTSPIESTSAAWVTGHSTRIGSHVHGLKSAKGTGCA